MEASALKRSPPLPRRLLAALGDERLAIEAQRGSSAAFEVVYDRYHRQLLAFCRHMLGSREDAEDALQQTFASAFRALPGNDRPAQLRSWLYTIARNRSLSMLRARREYPSDEVEQASLEGLSEEVERRAELKQIVRDLQHLPERQRAALVLSEVADLSHAEVAEVLDCEPKQVKSLVFQARSALARDREAQAIPCAEVREETASVRGRDRGRSLLRRHIRSCAGCAEFAREVRRQRELLAIALPVVPSLGLKDAALAAAGIGGGGGAAGGGGGLIAAIGAHGAAKVAAVAAVAGGAAGGVAAVDPGAFHGARVAVERAAMGLGQAMSGELDQRYAEQQAAEERREAQGAVRAERAKGRPDTSPNASSASRDASRPESANRSRSKPAPSSKKSATPTPSGDSGQPGGRSGGQAASRSKPSGGGSRGTSGRRTGTNSGSAGASGGRRLSPGRVVESLPRVERGARRALSKPSSVLRR